MKVFITFCLTIFLTTNLFAQEKELENFKQEFNSYLDFLNGTKRTIPPTEANQLKLRKKTDAAFKEFVILKNSNTYEKLVTSRDDSTVKFIQFDNKIFIRLSGFLVGTKTYIFYSYKAGYNFNYFIKDVESNVIVFDGDARNYLTDNIYSIDEKHFLLVNESGDHNSSRDVMVLSSATQPWTVIKAFEGEAFGQVAAQYTAKKYVKRRTTFQLECDMEVTMIAPKEVNKISFDPKTKTLSYKQYSNNNKPKVITSKWDNSVFVIDDYDVSENLSGSGTAVPR